MFYCETLDLRGEALGLRGRARIPPIPGRVSAEEQVILLSSVDRESVLGLESCKPPALSPVAVWVPGGALVPSTVTTVAARQQPVRLRCV